MLKTFGLITGESVSNSMKKAAILLLFVLFLSVNGTARLNSTIAQTCPSGYEPLISMDDPDATHNNPAAPSTFQNKVCVSGIANVKYGDRCRNTPAFYLSSNSTRAHFSRESGYNMKVCAGRMNTRVKNSCSGTEAPLFSVSDKINGFGRHVAGVNGQNPKVFSNIVCGFYRPPENVSVSMKFNLSNSDEIYFDGEQENSEFTYSGLSEFPYIVSTSGSHTAGIVAKEFKQVEWSLENKNVLRMQRNTDNPSFFIPFTEGGYENIESSQSELMDGEFLNQLDPSFSFFSPTQGAVRTVLVAPVDLRSNMSISRGSFNIEMEKTGETQVTIKAE